MSHMIVPCLCLMSDIHKFLQPSLTLNCMHEAGSSTLVWFAC